MYGNLLKVDSNGNILVCCHGFHFLRGSVPDLPPTRPCVRACACLSGDADVCSLQGGRPRLLPQQVHPEGRHGPLLHPQHALQPLRLEVGLLTQLKPDALSNTRPLSLQRPTSTPASWTSSPDATDTPSESSYQWPEPGGLQLLRRLPAGPRAAEIVAWSIPGLNDLWPSSLPASRRDSNTATCSCPTEACSTMSATPWTSSTTRCTKGLTMS